MADIIKTIIDTLQQWWLFALLSVGLMLGLAKIWPLILKDSVAVTFATVDVRGQITDPVVGNSAAVQKALSTLGGGIINNVPVPVSTYLYTAIAGVFAIIMGALIYKLLVGMNVKLGNNPMQRLAVVYGISSVFAIGLASFVAGGFGAILGGFNWMLLLALALYGIVVAYIMSFIAERTDVVKLPPL